MAYVNIYDSKYKRPGIWLHIFIGGRGCGKTYGALKGAWEDAQKKGEGFFFVRRTDEERKLAELFNPFSAVNRKEGTKAITAPIGKKVTGFYHGTVGDDGEEKPAGPPAGYMLALSTIGSIRGLGLDSGSVNKFIYDEFIPEPHVRLLKMEGDALFNALESLNRNRELEGLPVMDCYLLANSNKIDNPIFKSLHLVSVCERMIRTGKRDYYDDQRGLALHLLEDAEFTDAKKKTALARLTEGSDFYDMAYNNSFSYNDFTGIRRLNAEGYTPCYRVGDACVWQRKGQKEYYATYKDGSFAYSYKPSINADVLLGRSRHLRSFLKAYAGGKIIFESYDIKATLLDFFGVK